MTMSPFGRFPLWWAAPVLTVVLLAGCGGQESTKRSPSLSYIMAKVQVGATDESPVTRLDFSPMTKYIYEASSWHSEVPYWGPFVVHMLTGYGTELSQFGQLQKECDTQITFSPRDRHVVLNYRRHAGKAKVGSRSTCYARAEVWDPGGTLVATIPYSSCVHFSPDGEFMLCEDVVYGGAGSRYVRRPDGRFVRHVPGSGEFNLIDATGRVHEWDVGAEDGTFSHAVDGLGVFEHSVKLESKDLVFQDGPDTGAPCCLLPRAGGVFSTCAPHGVEDRAVILGPDGSSTSLDVREEIKEALGKEPAAGASGWRVSQSGDFILWYATGRKWRIVAFSSSGKEIGRLVHESVDDPTKEASLVAADFIGGRNYVFAEFRYEGEDGHASNEVVLYSPDIHEMGSVDPDVSSRAPVFSPGGDRFILAAGPTMDELSQEGGTQEEKSLRWVPRLYQSFTDRGIEMLVSRIGSAYKKELDAAKAAETKKVKTGTYVLEKAELIHHVMGSAQIELVSKPSHLTLVASEGSILMKGPELGFADRSNSPRQWCAARGKKKEGVVVFKSFHLLAPGLHADEASAFLVRDPDSGDLTLTVARRTALGEITRYTFKKDEVPVAEPPATKTFLGTVATKELESYVAKATWAIEQGDLSGARLALDKGAKINPVDPRILTLRGTLIALEGDISKAGKTLRMAIYAGAGDPAHAALSAVHKGELEARLSRIAGSAPPADDLKRIIAVSEKFLKVLKAGNAAAIEALIAQRDMALLAGYPDSKNAALYIASVTRVLSSKEIGEQLEGYSSTEVKGLDDLATVRVVSPSGLDEEMVLIKKGGKWRVVRFILPGSEMVPDPEQGEKEPSETVRQAINRHGAWSRIRGVMKSSTSHDLAPELLMALTHYVTGWAHRTDLELISSLETFISSRKDPQINQAAKKYDATNISDTIPFGMSPSALKQSKTQSKSLFTEAKGLLKKKKVGQALQKALQAQAVLPFPDPTISASIRKWTTMREAHLEAQIALQWASEGNLEKVIEGTDRARALDPACPLLKKLDKEIKTLKKASKAAGQIADQAEKKLEKGKTKEARKLALEALGLIQMHPKALSILSKLGERSEEEIALRDLVSSFEDENKSSAAREAEYDAEMKAIEDKIPGWKKKAKKYAKKIEKMAKEDIAKAKKKVQEPEPPPKPTPTGLYYFKWGVDSPYWDNTGEFGPFHSLDECTSERTKWLIGQIDMDLGPPSCDPECPDYYMDGFKLVAAHCNQK